MAKFKFLLVGFFIAIVGVLISFQNFDSSLSQQALIPRHLLFGNPEKAAPKISPDGTQLAYLAPDKNNVLNVWVKDLKDSHAPAKMVTHDKKRGIRNYLWQFDNKHVLYAQDLDGDENWHIYQTNIHKKETKDLTPFPGCKAEFITYNPLFPDEILVAINHRNKSLFDVYRIHLNDGHVELDTENPDGVFQWLADRQLKIRAAISYENDGSSLIRVRDSINDPWRNFLTIAPEEVGTEVVSFSKDGDSIYLLSNHEANTSRLVQYSLKDGSKKVLVEHPLYDLDEVLIDPETYEILAVGVEKDRYDIIALDPDIDLDFSELKRIEKGIFRIISATLSNRKWIVAFISDQKPTHYYIYDRDTKKHHFLFTTQPELEKYQLSEMTPISFKARDGMLLHGYLTLPVGKSPLYLPTVLFVHGGPWVRDNWEFNPNVQWLANRGYAVLQINYRGSSGYGKEYLNAGNKEWAGKMHTDLLDGKKWLIDQGYADPSKVAIYGGSYGGYATLVGLSFTPDEFCCGVDIVGPSNLITLLQSFPPYWNPLKAQTDRQIGSLEKDEEFLKSRSPLFKAQFIKKPLLIGQGANDPRVKQAESDQIVEVMRYNNLPVEYLLFKDEGHGFARPENRMKFYAAAEQFLAKYLGGHNQPPSEKENWDSLKR